MTQNPTTLDPEAIERQLRRMRSPIAVWTFNLWTVPLAALAGAWVRKLDGSTCEVELPGGWRTRNSFASTYWAAQGMAAELTTSLPAYAMTQAAPVPVRMIMVSCNAEFSRRCQGTSRFVCDGVVQLRESVERALAHRE